METQLIEQENIFSIVKMGEVYAVREHFRTVLTRKSLPEARTEMHRLQQKHREQFREKYHVAD